MARGARKNPGRAKAIRKCGLSFAHPAHQRLAADRRDLPERNGEDLSPRHHRPGTHGKRARLHDRLPRLKQPDLGIRPRDLSVQSLRLHRDAALSLALFLLPESLPRADPRLDERPLSPLGRGPWGHDRHTRPLVSGHEPAQAHDGTASFAPMAGTQTRPRPTAKLPRKRKRSS